MAGLFNLLNKWAEKENHWGFMGHRVKLRE
jgi:hypothetical protein